MLSDQSASDAPAIEVRGISKRYYLGGQAEAYGRLTESLAAAFGRGAGRDRQASKTFWALKDVSFDVADGEILGIIGPNGAGKSTLLKILSRITEPTDGQAVVRGRVASLLEVGTGFHPELSGRENIFLSGSILGMRRAEIMRRFDDIVAFADVSRFLDTPVKRYSSGMQVRLGFAVAAHLDPEILLVDEVLAVGDAAFQRKCLNKMEDVSHGGRTVIFVSHNMASIESLCRTGLLIVDGVVAARGAARDVVRTYLDWAGSPNRVDLANRTDRRGDGRLRFVDVETELRAGAPGSIRLAYRADGDLTNVEVSVGLFTPRGEGAAYLSNSLTGDEFAVLPRQGALTCDIPRSGILPGKYSMNIYCTSNGMLLDWIVGAMDVEVAEGDFFGTGKVPPPSYGSVAIDHRWSIEA